MGLSQRMKNRANDDYIGGLINQEGRDLLRDFADTVAELESLTSCMLCPENQPPQWSIEEAWAKFLAITCTDQLT